MKKIIIYLIMAMLLIVPALAITEMFGTSALLYNRTTNGSLVEEMTQYGLQEQGLNIYRQQQFIYYRTDMWNRVGDEKLNWYVSYSCTNPSSVETITQIEFEIKQYSVALDEWTNLTVDLTNSTTFSDYKYWLDMMPQDTAVVKMDTYYNGTLLQDSPCDFHTVLGTRYCSRCRELKYYEFMQSVDEEEVISDYADNILQRTYQVIFLNFEFLVILYWVVLISLFITVVGLLFFGILFLYEFVKHLITKIKTR